MRSKYIRFFVSSTFKDMELERNLLQEVFDELIPFYREKGWQVETIDLRWGISEEAGLDNRTMRICKKELTQCMKMSPKPNFIILLGNRYGWIPLPETIKESDFYKLEMTSEERKLFDAWYELDKNALPEGEYVLQGRTGDFCKKEIWEDHVVKPLGEMFRRNANRLHDESLYGLSATEQEIRQGALSVSDAKEHVLAYIRDINKCTIPNDKLYDYYEEIGENQEKIVNLRNSIYNHLSKQNIIENKEIDFTSLSTVEYKNRLKDEMRNHLNSIITNVIDGHKRESVSENEKHLEYAFEKARHFVGREFELKLVNKYLLGPETKPLWIKGSSGMGKSSLLAKIVEEYRGQFDIICRFCGTTEESSDAVSLVNAIWEEYKKRDTRKEHKHVFYNRIGWKDNFYEETPEVVFHGVRSMKFDRPILLIIDAIDQVYIDNYKDFIRCAWITAGNNPQVKIIFSSLDSIAESTPDKQIYMLPNLGKDAEILLYDQLNIHNRTLSEVQKEAITRCIIDSDRSPLFIYMLSQYLLDIPSGEKLKNVPTSIADLINHVLTDLSQPIKHGEVLVRTALSFLSLDRIGVSDSEMLSLLADNDEVYYSIIENSERNKHKIGENGLRRIPTVLWIRLSNDLKAIIRPRITEVGQMNTIFHNDFRSVLKERYLKENNYTINMLASLINRYRQQYNYGDLHSIKELSCCLYMAAQVVKNSDIDIYNKICKEIEELLTLDWVFIAKKKQFYPVSLIEDYDRTRLMIIDDNSKRRLDLYRNFLDNLAGPVSEEQVVLYFNNLPQHSSLRKSIEKTDLFKNSLVNVLSNCSNTQSLLYVAQKIGKSPCLSEDGSTIVSLFNDNRDVRIVDVANYRTLRSYSWPESILELICNDSITLCAVKTASHCYMYDTINNKFLYGVDISEKGWMNLSADGLTFVCGGNGNTYIYNNHKLFRSFNNVRIAKVSASGKFIWILSNDGYLFRLEKESGDWSSFPIELKDKQNTPFNPLETSEATIEACSDDMCFCHTPTESLIIFSFVQDEEKFFKVKFGYPSPIYAYSDDCRKFIDDTGHYWLIDDSGQLVKKGHFYLDEQLCCLNRSFTKALSRKELRVFDLAEEMGNYYISKVYQNGYINHAQCSNDGNEIVVSVGKVFIGPFARGKKTEALRYSSRRMFAWTPDSDYPFSGIYSSAVSPDGGIVVASVLGNPSKLIINDTIRDANVCIIGLPERQTGCTDIVFSADSCYLFAITGDYVSDPNSLYLYVINNSGKILFIKEWGWEYNRNTLYISSNNRFLILLDGQKYAVYDLIEEREIIDNVNRLPYGTYTFYQDITYCTLTKDYFVICPSTNVVLSSDKENNLLYSFDLDSCKYSKKSCDKVIIACSSTGRYRYYLDKKNKLYVNDWLRSQSFEHLLDNVLWVVPALDEHHIYITLTDYTIYLYNVHSRQIEQKAYRGMTTHQQACAQGLMTVNTDCEVSMYKAADYLNVNNPAVTTFARRWNLETKQKELPSAICPICGGKIELDNEIKQYIKYAPHDKRHEDWDNPKLFGHHCPHCNAELQYNPYIV